MKLEETGVGMEEKKVQKRTIESREKLRRAAFELFEQKGYFNTNTKEIAKLAGISVGNFYNYYKDKADIYCELAQLYVGGSGAAIEELSDVMIKSEDPAYEFHSYLNKQMDRAERVGCFFTDCQVLIRDDDRLKAIFDDGTQIMIAKITELIARIPGVKQRAPYPVMGRFIYNMINEMTNDILSTKGTPIYQQYLDQLADVVLNYLFGEKN